MVFTLFVQAQVPSDVLTTVMLDEHICSSSPHKEQGVDSGTGEWQVQTSGADVQQPAAGRDPNQQRATGNVGKSNPKQVRMIRPRPRLTPKTDLVNDEGVVQEDYKMKC